MLKSTIKQFLVNRRDAAYEKELQDKSDLYGNWYRLHLSNLNKEIAQADHSAGAGYKTEVVRYSHLRNYIVSGNPKTDIVIACDDDGRLTDYAETLIRDYFAANPDVNILYGDEDRIGEDGRLTDPWFKPDWSPDTFLSTFYFGNIFAFRSSVLYVYNPGSRSAADYESSGRLEDDIEEESRSKGADLDDSMRRWIYNKFCLKIAQADGGFSRRNGAGNFPIGHVGEVLFHANRKSKPWNSDLLAGSLTGRYSAASAATRLVSIIIPSKDNPDVLLNCIKSIEQYTESSPYEIIVVDNGSTEENQAKVRKTLEYHNQNKENSGTQYIVEPMEFNFSRMCNIGAEHANGELLLFLNDDIEIAKPKWLSFLSEKAKLPYVGAVGMKLLYPNSDIIQHAGIVNVHVGPIHKLQYCSNKEEHYFGYNKGVRNVIAVTGACLMVRTDVFQAVGGFNEDDYAVAFNDVDLCLRIYEQGYYNVVRNNMYLYHHESLTRGDDRKDTLKAHRLSEEQTRLLNAHPELFARDPFYHNYLVQDPAVTIFRVALEDVLLEDPVYAEPSQRTQAIPDAWNDPVLHLGVEFADLLDRWLAGPITLYSSARGMHRDGYYLKGYSFVLNADNAVYERHVLLAPIDEKDRPAITDHSGSGKSVIQPPPAIGAIYEVPTQRAYRPDIADNLTNQQNDRLTGWTAVLHSDALPDGVYQVGMLAIDKTSRQRLVNWSDVCLTVSHDHE